MKRNLIYRLAMALAGGFMLAAAFVSGASAQMGPCADHAKFVSWLTERFQERQAGFGLIGDRAVLELYVSGTGSWTVTITDTARRTCMVAAGESWIDIEPPAADAHDAAHENALLR